MQPAQISLEMDYKDKFAAIRPFEPEELPGVYDRILNEEQFVKVLNFLYPGVPVETIRRKMHECKTPLDFQMAFCYQFLVGLEKRLCTSLDMDCTAVDVNRRYTFVSNHRDIVIDSAFLDKLLIDNGFGTTCEIAIGDNLLSLPWVMDLVRINKSFIVRRGLPPREMLLSSRLMAEYMHLIINGKNDNIWIAQREGRAKDSDDRTQSAILKMMTMAGEGTIVEKLKDLHIVPLAISYEYDPCDYLKAREFQLKRDIAGWKKSAMDDVVSMRTGVMGYKGQVHYHCAPCIDDYLDSLSTDIPKTQIHDIVAAHIDEEIHRNYRLYPNNYVALDLLADGDTYASNYTAEDKERFEQYVATQIAKIDDVPGKDEAYLRERILTMYANPARNKLKIEK